MRTAALLLLVPCIACGASGAGDPVFVADFIDRSVPVQCTPVPALIDRGSSVGDVATLADTAALVLYAQDRELAVIGPDLTPRRLLEFTADGPTGVLGPASAAVVGDSLIYVADQSRQALRRFDRAGRDRGTIRLDFPPQYLLASAGGVLISPLVIGRHPQRLLYALEDDEARPRAVPAARFADPAVNALANTARLIGFPDGRVVVTHALVVPFAYVLDDPAAQGAVRRLPIPLPDGVRSRLGHIPPPPFTGEQLDEVLVSVIAAAPDGPTGDLLYLTRTGRRRGDRPEKAIIRADRDLQYRSSYLLDVNAVHFAYLTRARIALVADAEDQWYRCPIA